MVKYIIFGIVILNLALVPPRMAMGLVLTGGAQQDAGQVSPGQFQVLNILVASIEGEVIYSRDGRQFDISGAKVFNNSRQGVGTKGAELDFENGSLVQVILK